MRRIISKTNPSPATRKPSISGFVEEVIEQEAQAKQIWREIEYLRLTPCLYGYKNY